MMNKSGESGYSSCLFPDLGMFSAFHHRVWCLLCICHTWPVWFCWILWKPPMIRQNSWFYKTFLLFYNIILMIKVIFVSSSTFPMGYRRSNITAWIQHFKKAVKISLVSIKKWNIISIMRLRMMVIYIENYAGTKFMVPVSL